MPPHRDEERVDRLQEAVGELRGRLTALEAQVARALVPEPEHHGGLKTAVTFASIVVVPILVAILGGYFALKAAGLR